MGRKVIQLAGKTLVVSLPSKWARRNNVVKGDEVELEDKGTDMVIKTSTVPRERKTRLAATGMSERVYRWVISSLHKQGYDEIEVEYDDSRFMPWTQDLVKNLFVGFILLKQTPTGCVIRRVSQDMQSEFDMSLRRSFLVCLSMLESMIELYKKKDYKGMEQLLPMEKSNNQLTNFCERILNKQGHKEYEKTCFYYVIAWNNEKVCDDIKYACEHIARFHNKKWPAEILHIMDAAYGFYKEFYSCFFDFEIKRFVHIHEDRIAYLKNREKHYEGRAPHEAVVVSHLLDFIGRIDDFSASTIAVRN